MSWKQTSMEHDIEMQVLQTNGNDGATCLSSERVAAGNGDGAPYSIPHTESDGLLAPPAAGYNGETTPPRNGAGNQRYPESTHNREIKRIKKELNEILFWKVRRWMAILFVFLLIIAVIFISLAVCAANYEDEDEKFDPSLFKIPVSFNGSFELPNLVFREELLILSSNESQALIADLQEKLDDLYKTSPALARYFFEAKIHAFRKGSVTADYQLTFVMPEEQQDQLRNFTLSREMVYNVFRQYLYDQELDKSEPMYIKPSSLSMILIH